MEKVVIFGSTGVTGICAVEAAVQKGLNVRAFVRNPSKLPEHLRNSVEVFKGDVLNYSEVHNAIKNVTAVVAVLGTGDNLAPTTIMSEGITNIIKAMKELNVDIISVCLSGYLFVEPDEVPEQNKPLNDDHQREWDIVKQSGLKYVAVCPPHIRNEPGNGYEIKYDGLLADMISKYDLGKFLIDCLTQPEHYGKTCGIWTRSS